MDASTLQPFATQLHSLSVSLLRLRLRFGSPRHVVNGVCFRVAVDLVDETAQPPPRRATAVAALRPTIELVSDSGQPLPTLRATMTRVTPSPLRWRFNCVVTAATETVSSQRIRLRVACASMGDAPARVSSAAHAALQQFCVGSQWLCADASLACLILPVVSDEIRVASSSASVDGASASSSNSRCLRTFALLPPSTQQISIQEDYGHAMGSHVWDTSIWLSLALQLSASGAVTPPPVRMLELGSGCGLFACVFARLASPDASVVATERRDALPLLHANIERNAAASKVDICDLVWGEPSSRAVGDVDVVFAADVLYHWSAHEALLSSLTHLCGAATRVVIAHKHRSSATSARLEMVVSGDGADPNCVDCQWKRWRVERLVRLGDAIDLLQLTRR